MRPAYVILCCVGCTSLKKEFLTKFVSDLWGLQHQVNISGNFTSNKFTLALQYLKPGKSCGSGSICSELILHAGAALIAQKTSYPCHASEATCGLGMGRWR